ncbi:MAG: rhomboid family intramembrane serine protease [Bacteroidales bacterium]|nr:rhomboid family intramembrane serine protease [Bacteroidales bacterium]
MKKNLITTIWVTAIIWIVFIILGPIFGLFSENELNDFGIRPRTTNGLLGIIFSPFLHADWGHLISNTIPLFILTFVILHFYRKLWIPVTIFSIILGGLCVWAFAPKDTIMIINNVSKEVAQNHIGASGVIFSYIGFILFSGIFRKSFKSIIIGILVFILYGGALFKGIIPGQPGVSWQGHLFGAIAGVIAAYIYRNKYKQADKIN